MSDLKSPSDIARETLRLLASRRVSPTPENYRQFYHEITGQPVLVDELTDDQSRPAQLDEHKEQSPAAPQWGQLILDLLKQWETRHSGLTTARKREGLEKVGELIAEGQNVTAAFQTAGMFPPLVLRMLRVGENTGSLDTALANVSYFYNRDVRESIEKVQAMIEPVMTVTIGLILGWIMMAVLGPIYDIMTKMKT